MSRSLRGRCARDPVTMVAHAMVMPSPHAQPTDGTGLRLHAPDVRFESSYLAGIGELIAEGYLAGKVDPAEVASYFPRYVAMLLGKTTAAGVPDGFSPETELWLISATDEYIGSVKIRHALGNDHLRRVGGHIGYYIRPSHRARGHGTHILQLALGPAAELGLGRILVTCLVDNAPSRRVIEAAGGAFERFESAAGATYRRYWIDLR